MKKKVLQVLFCGKIGLELGRFKREMLDQEPEEIFAGAYEIDTKVTLYELLQEMSVELPGEVLQAMIAFPDLLEYLYCKWMEKEDHHLEELQECVKENLTGGFDDSEIMKNEVKGVKSIA